MNRNLSIITGMALIVAFGSVSASQLQDESHAKPRFVIQGNTVYDSKTDLTWQRCSVGQQWTEGRGCVGVVKEFSYEEAQRQGSGMWRVPAKDELLTLIAPEKIAQQKVPTIDELAFPDMDSSKMAYWTSTSDNAQVGWFIFFDNRDIYYYGGRSFTFAVRLVHAGP